MTIRKIAAVMGGALWLAGCATPYVEPPAGAGTVTINVERPLNSPAAAIVVFDDAKRCGGQHMALRPADPTRPIRVLAGIPTALAASYTRGAGTILYRCAVAATFVPQPGKQYRMRSYYATDRNVCQAAVVESDDGRSWHAINARYRRWDSNGAGSCPALSDADLASLRDKTRSPDGATTLSDLSDLMAPQ